jgi:hypothetical protein
VLVELADRLDKGVDQQHALVLGDLHRDSSFGESGEGPDLVVVAGEAFVVPPLSGQQAALSLYSQLKTSNIILE